MKRYSEKSLRSLEVVLRALEDQGALGPEQQEVIARGLKELKHALRIGRMKEIRRAIDRLARVFLK